MNTKANHKYKIHFIIPIIILIYFPIQLAGQVPISTKLQSIQDSIQKYYQNQPAKALEYAFVYEKIASDSDSLTFMAKADNFIGMCYYMNGQVDKAIKYYISGIKKFETIKDVWFVAMLNNNIGAAYQLRKRPNETIFYYLKALKGFEEVKDTIWIANLYNNISIQKNELSLYQEELAFKQKAMDIYVTQKDTQMILLTKGNLAHTYFKLGDYKKSLENAENFLFSPQNTADLSVKATVMLAYAYSLHKIGERSKSMKVINEVKQIAENSGLKEILMKAHHHLALLYEQQNNYRLAYIHYTAYDTLKEALFNQEKDETMNNLLVNYETNKKDDEISLLNAENKLKSMQINQANKIKWVLIFGIFLVLLLAFLVWRLKNIKAKTNLALTAKNLQISKALEEKNLLLREIHHRVKNNLQVISSLLKLQSQYIEDEGAIKAIAEGRNRVHSMALLHQNLYKDEDITGVNMKEYFTNLIEGLFDAYNINADDVKLITEIQDLTLDIDTVIPLGLIANELISNTLKHAFSHTAEATLVVKLSESEDKLLFQVSDNGKGYDTDIIKKENKSFGQKLIKSLSAKLDADVHVDTSSGTDVTLFIKDYNKTG